jgi:hypothetical protein
MGKCLSTLSQNRPRMGNQARLVSQSQRKHLREPSQVGPRDCYTTGTKSHAPGYDLFLLLGRGQGEVFGGAAAFAGPRGDEMGHHDICGPESFVTPS